MTASRTRNRRHILLIRWSVIACVLTLALTVAFAVRHNRKGEAILAAGADVEGLTSILSNQGKGLDCPIRFEDVTEEMGISVRHFPGQRSSLIAEDMGSGVAWGDYDGDGWVDLFVVNFAGPVTEERTADNRVGASRLYRNLGGQGFDDVTEQSALRFTGFGMAAAWGDYDSDGDLDLYVTGFRDNVLFNNNGGGSFRDVTEASGVNDARFSAGCVWGDYDRDGDLDLYVANYVNFAIRAEDIAKRDPDWTDQPWSLNPSAYEPVSNALFRNNGDGTFDDVASQAGVTDPEGRGLGVSWVDLDNDGWLDLYVANDVSKNAVFRNRGDGTFEDIGAASLAADYRSAMGLAIADVDDDLDQDLLITHWIAQENAYFRNMLRDEKLGESATRGLWFVDAADEIGLGQISLDAVGWATGFADFDNDGQLDLWLVNGHTFEKDSGDGDGKVLVPQPPFLFWNRGRDGYVEIGRTALPPALPPFAGRGGAQADFDRDGRMDLAWVAHQGPLMLLRNVTDPTGHWIRFELRQVDGNTYGVGARVYLTACDRSRMAEVKSSPSYLSQHEGAVHFGLGPCKTVDSVRIVWPDGTVETHHTPPIDQTSVLIRGQSSRR